MADYIEQVKIIGVVEADTSNLDAALEKYNKPIDIKVQFNGDNPFDNIQKDIKRIESSISSINFDALNKHLANSLQKGATEGLKEVKKTTSSTINKQIEELSKAKSELQKLQNTFNGMSQGMIKGGLDAALRGTLLLPIDQMREAQEEIKYLDQSLSNISTPGKLDKILSNIKSSLANIGGKELEESFSNYWEKAIQSSKEYQAILSQLETTQKKYNSLSSQNSSNNSSVNKMNQGLNEAKQSLRELDSLFNQIIGKTSKGKEITFGDSIKTIYNNLADLNKKLSSVISNDGQDNYTIKISVVGIEDILAKMQQLNSSTDSFQRNLQELNGISLFSGIESQFKEITSSITTLVGDIKVLKDSLESINKNVVLPQVETNSKSVSKNTLSNDEYEAVQDIARNNAKTLFQSKNMQILSMETKQLESGLAKVKATVKSAEGEWQNFNATITKTGALINQNFVTASDPISLDKKLDRLKTRGNNFSTEELLSQAQRIRTELGLIDNETWSIRVDSSGLVTIKNELAKTSDGAAKAVQTFKSAEEAIQKFNQVAKQSSVTLGQTTSKAKSSNELPDVKAIKDQLKQVEEIQKALDTNKLLSRNSALFKEYSGYSNVGLASKDLDSQIQNIKEYMRVLDDLNQKSKEADKAGKALEADDASKMVNTYKQLTAAMNTAENEIKSLKNAYGGLTTEQQRMRASNSMLKWLEQNSRATKQYGEEIKQLANDVQTAYTKMDFDKIQNRMSNIKLDAYNMGLTGKSLTESLKNSMGTVTQLFGSYSLIDRADDVAREMVSTIHEVDDALTDLKMATGVSDSEASKLMETYSQMGKTLKATGVDVATSATEWLNFIGHLKSL